ncbi:Condensin-2 complex subunit H2 [Habropoda laboriosa]|uniref:Condensin-2 complex subunit H2 n=1 Tax=Habropoda laboriosa TaxID=597456 RepID=A0A0L7R7A4_9HYME|nr:Condensin-2 complex subunit H2 [Habropoda laboriosa]
MVTLQDISIQLMKPAKDLADWKFPLSQILEEYYALLEEPCNVNFGEAALVLQNSTNVYRFTQLENNVTQLCIPIEVYDVLGEIIGKKYDFRCNQAINTSGMLVDELTPHDFTYIFSSCVQKGRNSLSSYSEPKTPGTGTSGYYSVPSSNNDESITLIHEEFEDECNSSSVENVLLANEVEVMEKEHITDKSCEVSLVNTSVSNQNMIEKNALEEQYTQKSTVQSVNHQNCSIQSSKEMNQIKTRCQTENLVQINQIKEGNQDNNKNIVQFETNVQIRCYKQLDHISKEDQVVQLNESNNVRWKEGLFNMRKRGNQTTKISICSIDDVNEYDWKPMPLIQGLKHVFSDNSSVLKLPDYISLLETKFGSKKRKLTSKWYKPECLTKFVLCETELFGKKGATLQTKQKFKHLQKEELEDFMKNFDECLNGTEKENDNCRCEAVANTTVDLLDFHISQNQDNSIKDSTEETSRSSSPIDAKLQSTICQDTLDMNIKSPNSCNNWCESSISEINLSYSLPDYQTLIEDKMKEIFKESNVITELDQTVAKWHASLQPKLSEAEIRPAFRIHDYASHIIGTLQALEQKKVNFDSIVQDKPACEVARYFLASLQLANTYNVEIKTKNSDNSIEITLINDKSNC